ncbi:MAG: hypothetical protein KatS3mg078_1867 [Deltaproteobacteria bacterium]|nr:MAG: hypothetical protein KatS3mg078_1867 [Deltaproteobacteria bacterium]
MLTRRSTRQQFFCASLPPVKHTLTISLPFLLGLFHQFLAGGLLQSLDELLFVLEGADVMFLLGHDEDLAREIQVVHVWLQLAQ